MDRPIRFAPFLRPMVWGGRRLASVLGKELDPGILYGESWEISDHPLHDSVAITQPWVGKTLRQLMVECRDHLLGPRAARYQRFPWLVKFLDARDWLSVQVHPDEEAVRRWRPQEGSKSEAWFVVAAEPGSRIYAGLRPGIDKSRLSTALASGTVLDCLHSFEPRAGDCVFLPAGTVHAVGGGVLLAEIQETSDATFRLFDWNRKDATGRPRELHVEEALASIHWNRGPVEPVQALGFSESASVSESCMGLVRCRYFDVHFLQYSRAFEVGGANCLQVLVVLSGHGHLVSTRETFERGQAWVLPAAMPVIRCAPESCVRALLCSLPESS